MNSTQQRIDLIRRGTDEVLNEDVLQRLVEAGLPLRHYIGFEISGRIHLGTGLMAMSKIRDFQRAGAECTVFLADWHSWINDKLGGDVDAIRAAAMGYFGEGLRVSLSVCGADAAAVRQVLASTFYEGEPTYWPTVIDVSKNTTLARMLRSITIMGRSESDSLDFAKLIYPAMQAADIFALGVNLAHAGMDQRKAHVIANDVALRLRINGLVGPSGERIKPVAVHHPLIMGLSAPPADAAVPASPDAEPAGELDRGSDLGASMKMSKSNPNSAVFVDDSEADIRRKVSRAWCPAAVADRNPLLNWARHLTFGALESQLRINRPEKFGGPLRFETYEELEAEYVGGRLHPADLKAGMADWLVEVLADAREHFASGRGLEMRNEMDRLLAANH